MTSRRFPGIELTEWRSRILDAHPRLFPDARPHKKSDGWALTSAGWPGAPNGWQQLLETLCRRIEAAIECESGEAPLCDLREKFGLLRIGIAKSGLSAPTQEAVDLAVDLAEFRSAQTCSICGERGRAWSDGGWVSVWCDEHAEGRPLQRRPGDDVVVLTKFLDGRAVSTARRYLYDEDRFITVPAPEDRR